jgi:Pro-kumamolisin, activation domain
MPATPANYKPLSKTERRAVRGSRRTGPANPQETFLVSIRLRRRADAPPLPSQLQTGLSLARSGAALSREEFAARYGADPADIERVSQFVRKNGLQIVETSIPRRTVVVSGNVSQMNRAFAVDLGNYESPHGVYRGREGHVQLPVDLNGVVTGVFGLDNRKMAEPLHVLGAAQANTPLTPQQVALLYDFPPVSPALSGQTIGILEFGGGFKQSDIDAFFKQYNLASPAITVVGVDGATNAPGGQDDLEVALDIDVAGAIAPNAQIAVYFTPWTEQGWIDAVTTAVHDAKNKPSVLSISWGWPENETIGGLTWTQAAVDAVSATFQEAALLGVTVLVASGDSGSGCGFAEGKALVLYPGSDPWVTTCGGTSIKNISGTSFDQATWNDNGATGGGVSVIFPPQAWQNWAKIPPSANPGGHIGRGVPDVAGNADPDSGYMIYLNGALGGPVGGTSAVAPLYAGLIARLNANLGKSVGYLNPELYSLAGTNVYRDIADGLSNATNGAPGYTSVPGWDACTGFGSIDGAALMLALQGGVPTAVAEFNNHLYIAWKEEEQVFWSSFDNSTWAPAQQVPGAETSAGASLAAFGGKLYMAWQGGSGDSGIYYTAFDGANWTPKQQVKGISSGAGPRLAVFGDALYMAWKSAEGDQRIFWTKFDGSAWKAQQQIRGAATSDAPALAVLNNILYASWKGTYGDSSIWYSSFNGTNWTVQTKVDGVIANEGPSLATFNNGLRAIWRRNFKDQTLYYSTFDGKTWAAQKQGPGVNSSVSAGLGSFGTSLYAVWQGTSSDRSIWCSVFDGSAWSEQKQIVGKS